MSNNTLMMAIIATLRPAQAVAPKVSFVGALDVAVSSRNDAGGGPIANTIPLPAGASVGDYLLLVIGEYSTFSAAGPAGSMLIHAAQQNGAPAVIGYFLTSADITAGSISVALGAQVGTGRATATLWRGVNQSNPLDVTPTFQADIASATSPSALTAPGLTTATAGCTVVFYGNETSISSNTGSYTTPAGFTKAWDSLNTAYAQQTVCYLQQAAAGAVADTSSTYTKGTEFFDWGAGLIALRPHDPTFRLTGTLAAGTVGTPYTGTLTFAGDFTAPLTFSGLPAWMGTPTIDYTAKTATWNGTPVEGSYTFTPVATDANSQVAPGSEQTVAVSAASAGPVLVQEATAVGRTTTGTNVLTLASTPVAGNTLLMLVQASNTISATNPTGWTLVGKPSASSGQRAVYQRPATGMGATITSPACSGTSNMQVQEWQGTVNVAAAEAGVAVPSSTDLLLGPLSAPAVNAVPVIGALFVAANPASTTWPAGWVWSDPVAPGAFPNGGSIIGYGPQTSAATGTIDVVMSGTRPVGSNVLWVGAWVSKP